MDRIAAVTLAALVLVVGCAPFPTENATEDRSRPDAGPPALAEPARLGVKSPELGTAAFMAAYVPSGTAGSPVDVAVHANRPIAAVHFQVSYGKWVAMERGLAGEFTTGLEGGPWEFWTSQTAPPMGSLVIFRTTAVDGSQSFSYAYSWAPNGD